MPATVAENVSLDLLVFCISWYNDGAYLAYAKAQGDEIGDDRIVGSEVFFELTKR